MRRWIPMMLLAGIGAARACGPAFPPSYLMGNGSAYRPDFLLTHELELIMESRLPGLREQFPKEGKNRRTAEVEDFRQAVAEVVADQQAAARLVADYATWQERARSLEEDVEPIPDFPAEGVEFKHYVTGVRQMHQAENVDTCRLPAAWASLLELPANERRYRTTWVHYTFANMCLAHGDLDLAERNYRRVLKSARDGFADSQALAGACFAKLFACAPTRLERLKRALPAAVYGDDEAVLYLRREGNYRNLSPEERELLLEDDLAREILAACIMCSSWNKGADLFLDDLAGKLIVHGERLAYIAYRNGDMEKAARFLAATPDESILKWWLQAKLCRWRGDKDGAARALNRWLTLYGQARQAAGERMVFKSANGENRNMADDVKGLLGTLLVDQNDFAEALYTFLEAGSWRDAAFVAERLLSLKRLQHYVDAACPPPNSDADDVRQEGYSIAYSQDPALLRRELRQLLGRRLARNGRFAEAARYLRPPEAENLRAYAQLLTRARDENRPARERAAAFYNAAKILRHHGLEIVGCELYPDAHIWGGNFAASDIPSYFEERGMEAVRREAMRTRPAPTLRFHYRYQAADLMKEACRLVADDDFRVVACYVGGIWLEARSPEHADPFYKELARIRTHPLGRIADEKRWFPRAVSAALEDEVRSRDILDYAEIVAIGKHALSGAPAK